MTSNENTDAIAWTEKYRPRTLDQVQGQDGAMKTIEAIVRTGFRRPPLLSGPPGDGKTSTARIAASMYLCEGTSKPCLECSTCEQIMNGGFAQSADFSAYQEFEGGWLDESMIQERFVKPYNEGDGRLEIVMIDEVQELPGRLQGMLLKPLEMSASQSRRRFILCTSDRTRLTKALVQRCDLVSFKHVSAPDMEKILKKISVSEQVDIAPEAVTEIIFAAGGAVREAISRFQDVYRLFPDRRIGAPEVLQGPISRSQLAAKLVCQLIKGLDYEKEFHEFSAEVMGAEIPGLVTETLCNAIRIKEGRSAQIDHLPERYRTVLSGLPDHELYMFSGLLSSPDFQKLNDHNAIELFLKSVTYRQRSGHFDVRRTG